ncbi:hypothetical protein D0864_04293 [Hortaea werneckii]|uniref:YTH domain-containing protein n=1 Tax=Hortaea werneckii TaxID=91943 RepID=A0A3M7GC56_HORWE|nr:hypothetical protein D0864_04293 [Hortaea werneckii]
MPKRLRSHQSYRPFKLQQISTINFATHLIVSLVEMSLKPIIRAQRQKLQTLAAPRRIFNSAHSLIAMLNVICHLPLYVNCSTMHSSHSNTAQESRIWPYTQHAYMSGYNMGLMSQHLHLAMSVNQMMAETEGAISSDPATLARPALEPAPIPPSPRGPSQKPKQAGHALWVGNLPPAANVLDLKDHFSYNATQDIVSLFLVTKSNCAFVNYRNEAACIAAMNRFHDSRFHGVRLVCRLKRGSTADLSTSRRSGLLTSPAATAPNRSLENNVPTSSDPLIVGQTSSQEPVEMTADGETGASTAASGGLPSRFFILKSLTVQDLQASVHSGTWATQFHNEQVINHAFHEATNVCLIFSANKSGEYFGYARMMSEIAGERGHLRCFAESDEAKYYGMPKSTSTLPTKTAPRGRIVDDIARGTLFWEAKHSENEAALAEDGSDGNGHTWGRQFKIEWLSTSRLPFYPTRGLRNPWNANREVKIARDGTELEPGLGGRLVQMFHNPLPSHDRMASVELAIPRTLYHTAMARTETVIGDSHRDFQLKQDLGQILIPPGKRLAIKYIRRLLQVSPQTWVLWLHACDAARFEQVVRGFAD